MTTTQSLAAEQPQAKPISRARIAALILSLHHYGSMPMPLGWRQNTPDDNILVIELESIADLCEWAAFLSCVPDEPRDRPDLGIRYTNADVRDWHGWNVQLHAYEPLADAEPPSEDAERVIADVLAATDTPDVATILAGLDPAVVDATPVVVIDAAAVAALPTDPGGHGCTGESCTYAERDSRWCPNCGCDDIGPETGGHLCHAAPARDSHVRLPLDAYAGHGDETVTAGPLPDGVEGYGMAHDGTVVVCPALLAEAYRIPVDLQDADLDNLEYQVVTGGVA